MNGIEKRKQEFINEQNELKRTKYHKQLSAKERSRLIHTDKEIKARRKKNKVARGSRKRNRKD